MLASILWVASTATELSRVGLEPLVVDNVFHRRMISISLHVNMKYPIRLYHFSMYFPSDKGAAKTNALPATLRSVEHT